MLVNYSKQKASLRDDDAGNELLGADSIPTNQRAAPTSTIDGPRTTLQMLLGATSHIEKEKFATNCNSIQTDATAAESEFGERSEASLSVSCLEDTSDVGQPESVQFSVRRSAFQRSKSSSLAGNELSTLDQFQKSMRSVEFPEPAPFPTESEGRNRHPEPTGGRFQYRNKCGSWSRSAGNLSSPNSPLDLAATSTHSINRRRPVQASKSDDLLSAPRSQRRPAATRMSFHDLRSLLTRNGSNHSLGQNPDSSTDGTGSFQFVTGSRIRREASGILRGALERSTSSLTLIERLNEDPATRRTRRHTDYFSNHASPTRISALLSCAKGGNAPKRPQRDRGNPPMVNETWLSRQQQATASPYPDKCDLSRKHPTTKSKYVFYPFDISNGSHSDSDDSSLTSFDESISVVLP